MCLHKQTSFFILPPSSQEGGQGDGATYPGRSLRVSHAPKGESRGAPPQWQESEGVPQPPSA